MRKELLFAAAAALLLLAGEASAAGKAEIGTIGLEPGSVDSSIKPGDDFWGYVNNGWVKRQTIPADRSYWGDAARLREQSLTRVKGILDDAARNPVTEDQKKVGALYAAFMDEAGIEKRGIAPLQPDLARIARVQTPADLARTMAVLERSQPLTSAVGVQGIFPVSPGINADLKDPTKHEFYLGQGGLGLPDRDYYLGQEPKMAEARAAYRTYLVTLFNLIGQSTPEARADRVIAFETDLARTHWARADRRDLDKVYNPVTAAELARRAPGFDWQAYLTALGVAGRPRVIVSETTALDGFAKLAAATPMETWRDYLTAHVVNAQAPYLPKAFVEADFAFHGKALAGVPELRARWKRGVDLVNLSMGDAVGHEYANRYFPPEAKAQVEDMIDQLKAAFSRRIDTLAWMAPETKVRAKAKLAALKVEVGYPDHWRNYSALKLAPGDIYASNGKVGSFEYDYQIAKLGKPVDRSEWGLTTTPQTVNAFNYGSLLKLAFPAGFVSPPFFDPAADPAVNYGAIGTTIGHEISHSFDDQGAKLDDKGRLITWWTPADTEAFRKSTTALASQFGEYEPLPGLKENGQLTLGENVGDLGGVVAALDAYHASLGGKPAPVIDGLTGDQRFFMAYAQAHRWIYRDDFLRQIIATDPHGSSVYRADTVRNLDEWYVAFDVKPGDKLYLSPEKRVRIW